MFVDCDLHTKRIAERKVLTSAQVRSRWHVLSPAKWRSGKLIWCTHGTATGCLRPAVHSA
jgi:hypothetical protein